MILRHVRLVAPRLARCRCRQLSVRTLDTPFISDSIPLAEGILGTVEELLCSVGDSVKEDDVVAVVETDKVSLDVRATASGVVAAVCVEVGEEVKERQPIYELVD
uniref:Lipoyl-binding domain-containing protein n=1 Tax=Phaeocystis antarctica TaxID=33657 RepID=A0A7S0EU20_9EUKA|mmetsp:Transcript_30425/g.71703  ORF Transcript_30425/g.71703 Transcript_30425/m.71703 type:complete len:105 (+) Transcript_30425:94-408(+)